jgi:hypothetical protein
MNNFKKGDIVYFLGNVINENSIGTCYNKGDRVEITKIITRPDGMHRVELTKILLDNSRGLSQTVQLDQISFSKYTSEEEKILFESEILFKSEKTLNKLTEFPKFGWCLSPKKEFVDFLAKYFNADIIIPGKKGVAWNAHSYWPINNESSKPKFDYKQLKHFIEKDEKTHNFQLNDFAKISISHPNGVDLKLDDIVKIIGFYDNDNKILVADVKNKSNNFLIDTDFLEYLNEEIKIGDIVEIINSDGLFNKGDMVTVYDINYEDIWPLRCIHNISNTSCAIRIEYVSLISRKYISGCDPYIEEDLELLKQKSKDIKSGWVKEYIDRVPKASIYISKNKSTNKDLVISLLNVKDRKIK